MFPRICEVYLNDFGIEVSSDSIFKNVKIAELGKLIREILNDPKTALKKYFGTDYKLVGYEQHALTDGSSSQAISYVGVEKEGRTYWGAGVHEDIITSSIRALVVAINNCFSAARKK